MPTNAAFDAFLVANKLPRDSANLTDAQMQTLKAALATFIVPWKNAHDRWPKYFTGCTLLGVTHNVSSPLNSMGLDLWSGRGPGLAANKKRKLAVHPKHQHSKKASLSTGTVAPTNVPANVSSVSVTKPGSKSPKPVPSTLGTAGYGFTGQVGFSLCPNRSFVGHRPVCTFGICLVVANY